MIRPWDALLVHFYSRYLFPFLGQVPHVADWLYNIVLSPKKERERVARVIIWGDVLSRDANPLNIFLEHGQETVSMLE